MNKPAKKAHPFRKIVFIVLSLLAFLALGIALQYFLSDYYMSLKDWEKKYTPTAELSELHWNGKPPAIYYLKLHQLYSRIADGSKEKLIFSNKEEGGVYKYFLIDKSRKIVVFTQFRAYIMDADGENKSLIFDGKDGYTNIGYSARLSPNQNTIAFFLKRSGEALKLYVFNTVKNSVEEIGILGDQFFLNEHPEHPIHISSIYWLKDNETIIWRYEFEYEYKSDSESVYKTKRQTQIVSTNIRTKKSNLVCQYEDAAAWGASAEQAHLAARIGKDNLVLPEVDDEDLTGLTLDPSLDVFTNDKKHLLSVKDEGRWSTLFVDNKKVIAWENWAKKAPAFINFNWLPDEKHIIFEEWLNSIRILDLDTGKTAKFTSSSDASGSTSCGLVNPKWFGKKTNAMQPKDW